MPGLISARLAEAQAIAWSKFHSGVPVHDPARETELLFKLVHQGTPLGLDSQAVRTFFSAQFAASRQAQQEWLDAWNAGTKPRPTEPPLDLDTVLRPRLEQLNQPMLEAIFETPDATIATTTTRALEASGFSKAVIDFAVAPLRP